VDRRKIFCCIRLLHF